MTALVFTGSNGVRVECRPDGLYVTDHSRRVTSRVGVREVDALREYFTTAVTS